MRSLVVNGWVGRKPNENGDQNLWDIEGTGVKVCVSTEHYFNLTKLTTLWDVGGDAETEQKSSGNHCFLSQCTQTIQIQEKNTAIAPIQISADC